MKYNHISFVSLSFLVLIFLFPLPIWILGASDWFVYLTWEKIFVFSLFVGICLFCREKIRNHFVSTSICFLLFSLSFLWVLYEQKFNISIRFSLLFYLVENFFQLREDAFFLMSQWKLGIYFVFLSSIPVFLLSLSEKRATLLYASFALFLFFAYLASLQIPERKTISEAPFSESSETISGNYTFPAQKLSSETDVVIFFLEGVGSKDWNRNDSQEFHSNQPVGEVRHFYIPVPHSSKSIFTGLTGMIQIGDTRPRLDLFPKEESLPKIFEKNGYRTMFLFSQPSVFENIDEIAKQYFQTYTDQVKIQETFQNRFTEFSWGTDDLALLEILDSSVISSSQPLFLWIGFSNTHSPYFVSETNPFLPKNKKDPYERFLSALRYDIHLVDKMMNRIVSERKRDVLFILTSDHGESFGEDGFFGHNFSIYNSETKVPFLIRYTKNSKPFLLPAGNSADFKNSLLSLFQFPGVSIDSKRNFFSEDYEMNLRLKSWNSDAYLGIIEGHKKWIYHSEKGTLYEMDLEEKDRKERISGRDKSEFLRKFHEGRD
ncbi:sulfatase-like hydrolase/transferase [Leptospira idonii]|uniref:Sulfatase N-terminal domain-containing protein n=1 Tax=Leptospira idonii TaxID=1193500 RepID=A0A4R9LVQ7_9LEPT|nr:sulfatase-like hydrolase/transferase [Leptospira idonii]TGN17274.1 hypothetical protein EHS15_17195 [Leptospira idonii]